MKKIVLSITICFAILISVKAQTTLDLSLYNKVQASSKNNSNQLIDVLVQGNLEQIKKAATLLGGTYKYACGDIASINMPMKQIGNLASQQGVMRLEAFTANNRPLNDTVLKNCNVYPVHIGQAPLTQSYDGTGVVLGFIDTGIDFTHPDFQDATHHSRIKYLWDQNLANAANTPATYNYGQEFTNTDIDNGLAAASNDLAYSGHGTHVAGIAVGNGLSGGSYKGVAPGADIIMVAVNFSAPHSIITDGANYIFAKAQAMLKPCVINISIGGDIGSHDGADLQAQMLNNMISTQAGRAIVAAVGNDGALPYHLGYIVTSDTNFTLMDNSSGGLVDFQIFGDVTDLANVKFSIGADQMTPTHTSFGHIPFSTAASHIGIYNYDTLRHNGNRIGYVQSHTVNYTGPTGSAYYLECIVVADSLTFDWRLMATGSGKFDLWSFDYNCFCTHLVSNSATPLTGFPDIAFYKDPDVSKTVSSSYQCLTNVITVGNYTNRKSYIDVTNTPQIYPSNIPGAIAPSSSLGPTRDGRIKPDVCSPGDLTLAAVVRSLIPDILANYPDALTLDTMHVRDGGSSHASPSVAGIAALYLQKNPTATAAQVRNALIHCTTTDGYTGANLPNNTWGYGKANAFTALTGCTSVGIEENNAFSDYLLIYPNPSSPGNSLTINVPNFKATDKTELKVFNSIGQIVKNINLVNVLSTVNNTLPAGVYFCNLTVNGKMIITKKLVIL